VVVHPRDEAAIETVLPVSVLRYVLHSRESIILDDAAAELPFATDPYIRDRRTRSALCLPLINQGKLVGALYLENNLTPNVFAPSRMAALKLLASQAAISLENSRLYGDLQEQEAKVRRLVDANIIGIFIFGFDGVIVEANDAFLRMVGYDRDDLAAGRIRWGDLTPLDWRRRNPRVVGQLKSTGTVQPYEKEYFRKDGSRVPVLVGSAAFGEQQDKGVAFVLDLTERKRAEAEARENEQRYRETQMELAHANRIATMGQLTASIAHEVNQPITATIGNAEAAMRWLARRPPDLEEVRQLLERIAKDGRRVGSVVDRIRELVKKAPLKTERMEINRIVGEVIELARDVVAKSHISVRTQLSEGLPPIEADRTQLQQVMLNLLVNAVQALSESDEGSRELFIGTSANEPHAVLVSVSDTGPGISPECLGRLFDPFYTTKPGGMGMGLSICRSIVESYGGRIWATANVPQGTTFHFIMPATRQ
jgi:PAS domain S-box-containing protein